MEHESKDQLDLGLSLPLRVISFNDVARLERELESINDFFDKSSLQGANAKTLPQASATLRSLFEENKLNILEVADRQKITQFINKLRQNGKLVNVSFAVEPKPDVLMKLLQWFRREAHPHVLLRVGLQPTIAAGCIVRTTNKYYDFSFKEQFSKSKQKLSTALGSVNNDGK